MKRINQHKTGQGKWCAKEEFKADNLKLEGKNTEEGGEWICWLG